MPAPLVLDKQAAHYRFGNFRLCRVSQELRLHDAPVELGARAISLLMLLVEHAGKVVSKEKIFENVWGGRAVEDNNLTVQMSALRRALAQGSIDVNYIKTVPGQGYIFVGIVERDEALVDHGAGPDRSLPARNAFIGRVAEVAGIQRMVEAHRLVTIAGLGGIGKTRLLEEVAPALAARFRDGLIRVDLAPITQDGDVNEAIACAVGAGAGTRTAMAAVQSALCARTALLVLDNAEHLLAAVVPAVHAILESCGGISILVTSRSRLGLSEEAVLRLDPLAVPEPDASPADALACEAVQLFLTRAQALMPGFSCDAATLPEIAQICRRLDGIALAIEMVVPRLQILTPRQISERLDDRFLLLRTGRAGVLTRQRTLRTMFDWSWELLDEDQHLLLGILATFAGSAPLSGVATLAASRCISEWSTLDALAGLVDSSLVIAKTDGPEPRYRLLETTRHYALAQLEPRALNELRADHAAFLAARFEEARAAWPVTRCITWIEQYGPDVDSLRAALAWSFGAEGSVEVGLRLAAGSYGLWWDLPGLPLREGHRWLETACSRIDGRTPCATEAHLRLGHSWRDVSVGDIVNFEAADRSAMLFRQSADAMGLGAALWRAGSAILTHERLETARTIFAESERLLRTEAPSRWLGLCLIRRGDLLAQFDRPDAAIAAYREAHELVRGIGCWYGLATGGTSLAELLFRLDRHDEALTVLAELHGELPPGRRCLVAGPLAAHCALAGHDSRAMDLTREVIAWAAATGLDNILAAALKAAAMILAEDGATHDAARLDGFAQTIRVPSRTTPSWDALIRRVDASLARGLTPSDLDCMRSEGARWHEPKALSEAARLCGERLPTPAYRSRISAI